MPDPQSAVVVLDVFSGRPNPTWSLDAEPTAALRSLLAALPSTPAAAPLDGLGYRGFLVELKDQTGATVERLSAYRGLVQRQPGDPSAVLLDPGRTVERFLLDSGRSQLDPALFNDVELQLNMP